MVTWIRSFNFIIMLFFVMCYAYQIVFVFIRFFFKEKKLEAKKLRQICSGNFGKK